MVRGQLPLPKELKSTPSISPATDLAEDQIGGRGTTGILKQIPQVGAKIVSQGKYFVFL
jgi:hypothetical protein